MTEKRTADRVTAVVELADPRKHGNPVCSDVYRGVLRRLPDIQQELRLMLLRWRFGIKRKR